jgi:transcriptional regulator with XRE-family HTH domain
MLPNEAFETVLKKYNITQQEISSLSGVDKGVISRFINGVSDMKTSNLQKLVKSLPPQAKAYYYISYDDFSDKEYKVAEKSK